MPSSPSALPDILRARPFAHRGLHGGQAVENGRAAFLAAIEAGHGIECDVRPARDGTLMVFHDRLLDRLTDGTGPVAAHDPAALAGLRLGPAGEAGMPTLAEMLALVGGRVPLLIEVKVDSARRPAWPLARGVADALDLYAGPAAVMSFDPRVPRWFWRHRPHVPRGLVVTERDRPGRDGAVQRRLAWRWAHPDFLACDVRDLPSALSLRARAAGRPVLTWTVRSAADRARAAAHADQIIYEAA